MTLNQVAKWLVLIGAINWGLVGLGRLVSDADWNLVHAILGSMPMVESIVYVLVGLSAVVGMMRK